MHEQNSELINSSETALAALFEVANMEHVGPQVGVEVHSQDLATLLYDSLLPGYPGWRWAVTLTKAGKDEPITVSEVHLQPGESSLLAPDWVPWAERLAAFRKSQALIAEEEAAAALAAAEELRDEDEIDPAEDLLENDFSDFDDEIDGVDIDTIDIDTLEIDGIEAATFDGDSGSITTANSDLDDEDKDEDADFVLLDEDDETASQSAEEAQNI